MNHGIGLAAKNLLSLSSAARKTEDAFVDWIWRSSRIWTAFVRPWMINSTFKCSPASELRHSYCVSRMWKLLPKKSFVLLSSRSCEDCDDMIIPEEPARTRLCDDHPCMQRDRTRGQQLAEMDVHIRLRWRERLSDLFQQMEMIWRELQGSEEHAWGFWITSLSLILWYLSQDSCMRDPSCLANHVRVVGVLNHSYVIVIS